MRPIVIGACVFASVVSGFAASPAGERTARFGDASGSTGADEVTSRDVMFFSEAVQCRGKIFMPKGFTPDGKAPAVVLAPPPGDTAASIEKYAVQLAGHGLVAMAFDYRGWGRSGGFLYLAEPIRYDDRLRFSQHTAKMRIRRKRIVPDAEILDIRNAISYLQGEPGVDRGRIGLWGAGLAGGHAIVTAAVDSRVRAVVVQTPSIDGKGIPRKAMTPTPSQQAAMVRLARTGQAPATSAATAAANDQEAKLALAEYHPFWFVDQIPSTTGVLFVVAEKDGQVNNDAHAIAASKILKGPNGVTTIPGATHALSTPQAFEAAVDAAAKWFQKYL
jgi:dienelactone hydrolase